MSDSAAPPRWKVLVTPRWLGWHLFAVVAFVGMLWLGDWQFRRAMAGNTLSWAYTFEWPIFAVFGAVFWAKTVRDELHPAKPADAAQITLPVGAGTPAAARDVAQLATGTSPVGHDAADHDVADHDAAEETGDVELAEYNAYLAMLSKEVKRHGKWHGLR
jgi:hypothetical protein